MVRLSDKILIQILLHLALLGTTYVGIALNGGDKGTLYVNGLLRDFVTGISHTKVGINSFLDYLTYAIIIADISLYILPFLLYWKNYKWFLVCIPATYLVLNLVMFPPFIVIFIPFIIVWILLLRSALKKSSQLNNKGLVS